MRVCSALLELHPLHPLFTPLQRPQWVRSPLFLVPFHRFFIDSDLAMHPSPFTHAVRVNISKRCDVGCRADFRRVVRARGRFSSLHPHAPSFSLTYSTHSSEECVIPVIHAISRGTRHALTLVDVISFRRVVASSCPPCTSSPPFMTHSIKFSFSFDRFMHVSSISKATKLEAERAASMVDPTGFQRASWSS